MDDDADRWLGLPARMRPVVQAGVVLGLGLGGFFDGIVFHQLLQWHHMASAHPDPSIATDLPLNVRLDGVFHAATYGLTVIGIGLLWRAWRIPSSPPSRRALVGAVTLGWGCFNVVEGLVNHHLLGLHHVWPDGPGPVLLWDVTFLLWGLLFIVAGYALARRADVTPPAESAPTG